MIEKKTDELRQITKTLTYDTEHTMPESQDVVIAVQQKWLVENGSPYSPPNNGRPDSIHDQFMGIIDGRAMWQPMKAEWRTLPIVTELEARKDSQT